MEELPMRRVIYEPRITLGNLLQTVPLLVVVVVWGVRLEGKVEKQDERHMLLVRQIERDQSRQQETDREVKEILWRIEGKLDRKVDKPGYPP